MWHCYYEDKTPSQVLHGQFLISHYWQFSNRYVDKMKHVLSMNKIGQIYEITVMQLITD